jgi:hypothetical protein
VSADDVALWLSVALIAAEFAGVFMVLAGVILGAMREMVERRSRTEMFSFPDAGRDDGDASIDGQEFCELQINHTKELS